MITLEAFLVFLFAASLPVTYILICSRWIERADRQEAKGAAPKAPEGIAKAALAHAA